MYSPNTAICSAKGCFHHDAKNCESAALEGISFHPFPRNPALRSRWVNQMNDESFVPTSQSMLCSLHFIKEYFITDARGVQYLKPDAIPTEFEFEFENGDIQDENAIVCCAYRCSNSSNSGAPITLHQFPVDQPELCDQWLLAMNVSQVEADKAVLCSAHFDESWFIVGDDGERHLRADAIPSIFLFPDPEEFEEDENTADEEVGYYSTGEPENNPSGELIRTELSEGTLSLMQKHDDIVRSVIEEERRLIQTRQRRIRLEKKRKNLEFLMRVVLQGGHIDRETFNDLKPLISEVDEAIQTIVSDCLAPCVSPAMPKDGMQE